MRPEIAVQDVPGVERAATYGADRFELCRALQLGGLTPSQGLRAACTSPFTGPSTTSTMPERWQQHPAWRTSGAFRSAGLNDVHLSAKRVVDLGRPKPVTAAAKGGGSELLRHGCRPGQDGRRRSSRARLNSA